MGADRYLLRLYRHGLVKREQETNVDPRSDVRLRELIEEQVKAHTGTLRLDLSDGWQLQVLGVRGGPIRATVHVDAAGRTVVRR